MEDKENKNGTIEEISVVENPQNKITKQDSKSDVYYNNEGKPIFVNKTDTSSEAELAKRNLKKGAFIASLITTLITIICTIASIAMFASTVRDILKDSSGDLGQALATTFVFFTFIVVGWIVFIPGLGSSIAGISCSAVTIKSSNKTYKILAIIALIINIICLALIITMPLVLPYIVNANT